jgi:Fe-S-cluster-containing dehydrogenase component
MMKCDMCFDRTSIGKKPMCATVCPSQALWFGPPDEIQRIRRERPVNDFRFGHQTVTTKVNVMTAPENNMIEFDVAAFMAGGEQTDDLALLSLWEDSYVQPG